MPEQTTKFFAFSPERLIAGALLLPVSVYTLALPSYCSAVKRSLVHACGPIQPHDPHVDEAEQSHTSTATVRASIGI